MAHVGKKITFGPVGDLRRSLGCFGIFFSTLTHLDFLAPGFTAIVAIYLVSNVLYSGWLKKVVILDVMIISMGFVLRAMAGGIAIGVTVSAWLILCTILIAFQGSSQRCGSMKFLLSPPEIQKLFFSYR